RTGGAKMRDISTSDPARCIGDIKFLKTVKFRDLLRVSFGLSRYGRGLALLMLPAYHQTQELRHAEQLESSDGALPAGSGRRVLPCESDFACRFRGCPAGYQGL